MKINRSATSVLIFAILLLNSSLAEAEQSKGTVLVAGATGSIGRIVIKLLKDDGYAVRAMTRNPDQAAERYGTGYQWVRGDVRDPAELDPVMDGVDWLICSIGYTEFEGANSAQFVDYMGVRNLVDAAKDHGVKHFVLVSASSAGPYRDHTQNPRFGYVAYWKTKGEQHLKDSGLSFTIVGPGGYMDAPAGVKGVRIFPRSEFSMGYIGRADVAAIVVASLTDPDARNKAFAAQSDDSVEPGAWRDAFSALQPE
jgi:uncharacterized protein YbjT (DUF2867 family)